ncbi:MAG: hypothetical protein K2I18_09035 [Paramuribaculum sp.]|nr:hypothetical protein [Paramuribaculum sp.]
MNFTLTPGIYAALDLLSKSARIKVLEAAFAFVICGIRPEKLPKNLLVMFMMVVDSASEGKLTYIPDKTPDEQTVYSAHEEPCRTPEEHLQLTPKPEKAPEETKSENSVHLERSCSGNKQLRDAESTPVAGIKKTIIHHRRIRNRRKM